MRVTNLIALAGRDLYSNKARAAIATAGIAIGVAVLVVISGLGLGTRDIVLKEVVQQLPLDMIEVIPKAVDLGLFKVKAGSLFGGGELDKETLDRLSGLPHVVAAYPKIEVQLPLGAEGGMHLFKRRLHTDIFMTGLPEELLQPELGDAFRDRDDVVPVVVSDQLIEIYNTSIAPTVGGPTLTAETLKGFEFDLIIGRSVMLGRRGAKSIGVERARIVGASRYAMRLGVTVPIATAHRILEKYADDPSEKYASFLLKADSVASVPEVTEAVRATGLSVDETASRTGDILTTATVLASLVGLLVLALAALNIAHSFFASLSERKRELAIMRATGARRVDLVALVLTQAFLLGVCGAVLGGIIARTTAAIIDWGATIWLPQFPFKPTSFFVLSPSLYALALLAAVLAALLGALWPALRSTRAQIAQALADQ